MERVAPVRFTFGEVVDDDAGRPQGLTAARLPALRGLLGLEVLSGDESRLAPGTVMVGESHADNEGLAVGDTFTMRVNERRIPLEVVGIFADNAVLPFPVVTDPRTLLRAGLPDRDNLLVVDVVQPGPVVESQLEQVIGELPMLTLKDQAAFAQEQREPIDQLVLMIFALLGLALLIAVLGIVNTLALSVIERTREIGLLRAIGLQRGQLRRMITVESVVIAMLGATLGVGLGVGFGIALMHSLRDQGLEVISVPWDQLAVFGVVALLVGVVAAVLPARRAAQLDVLKAIGTD